MESGTVVTIGLAAFAVGLIFFGWRAARWLAAFAGSLRDSIVIEIKAVRDEFTAANLKLNSALDEAKADFENVVKEMGEAHQAFREKTMAEFRLLEKELMSFQLTVSQQYASKGDMQQSVQIILTRIDSLSTTIEGMKRDQASIAVVAQTLAAKDAAAVAKSATRAPRTRK